MLDTLFFPDEVEFGALSWTSEVGCGAWASNSTRRHSARTQYEKVLPRLTAEDLKDLGVVIVGHRRMLLDVITKGFDTLDLKEAKALLDELHA